MNQEGLGTGVLPAPPTPAFLSHRLPFFSAPVVLLAQQHGHLFGPENENH